jgi:hypothetical protein
VEVVELVMAPHKTDHLVVVVAVLLLLLVVLVEVMDMVMLVVVTQHGMPIIKQQVVEVALVVLVGTVNQI